MSAGFVCSCLSTPYYTRVSPFNSESTHKTGKYPKTTPGDRTCCCCHLVKERRGWETVGEGGEEEGEGEEGEVDSLDKEEDEEDGEVANLHRMQIKQFLSQA